MSKAKIRVIGENLEIGKVAFVIGTKPCFASHSIENGWEFQTDCKLTVSDLRKMGSLIQGIRKASK